MHPSSTIPSSVTAPAPGTVRGMSRKTFLLQAGLLVGACLAGCTPARILLHAFPSKFENDPTLIDEYLRAFVLTVIPGAPPDDPNLVRIYTDEYYPFAPRCGFFVSDLATRSREICGREAFPSLTLASRSSVVRSGLGGDAIVSRLYQAAIYMAQVSFYGSIYDDARGCPLIDVPGTETYVAPEELTYADAPAILARELTTDGNFA